MQLTESTDALRFELGADGIAQLTLDVAGRPMNVLTAELIAALDTSITRIVDDASVVGVLLTSAKPAFLAGADLKDFAKWIERGVTIDEAVAFSQRVSQIFRRLETCGKPVAVAINGAALGGGFELCLACHYRVLADHPSAVIGLPEVKVGLLPAAGGTQRLPRLIGIERALPLLLEGRSLAPLDALQYGVVDAVAPLAEIGATARAWLRQSPSPIQRWDQKGFAIPGGAGLQNTAIAQQFMIGTAAVVRSYGRNYPAPLAILSAVSEGTVLPLDRALRIESQYFAQLLVDPVAGNLIRTGFINKGLADKLARRPPGVPPSRVSKVGILGAGMMGAGIAHASARVGLQVVLLDIRQELADKGRQYSVTVCDAEVQRGRMTAQSAADLTGRIHATADYADLSGCDLIIESVFEQRDIKDEAIRRAEAATATTCLLASNTSTLPITGLSAAASRPTDFIGLHFFSPAERMPLVEVIVGRKTSKATLARALDYVAQLKKTPIVVNDSRGFYTSRVFRTFCREGMRMLEEGVAPALIENAARQAGMPVGPLAVADEVTIELLYKLAKQEESDLGERYRPDVGYEVVRTFVEDLKRLGKRYGAGFYEYPTNGRKYLWPELSRRYPTHAIQPSAEELRMRFLYIQALETARCLEEDVIEHPADADLGSLYGWGYPAWTGGTLSYIDTIGLSAFVATCQQFARRFGPRFKPSAWLRARADRGETFHPGTATRPTPSLTHRTGNHA